MLPDVLSKNLRIVFCGTAAGTKSAELGQYYAGPGNKFWRMLATVGLTPQVLEPADFRTVLDYGLGLTDVIKDQSGGDIDLDFKRAHPQKLRDKILELKPRILCFNGKRAAQTFLRRKITQFGVQPELVGVTIIFVAPSTSGAASGFWDPKFWIQLGALARKGR